MARYELSDFEWSVILPLLPNKTRGKPRVDDRRVLNGIFWVLRAGAPCVLRPSYETSRSACYAAILNPVATLVASPRWITSVKLV